MMPVRVGLIGYGFVGKGFHAPLITATRGLNLVAISSSDPAKVQADLTDVAVFDDPLAMMASGAIDLVVVASPNVTHVPLAIAAIENGLHVVVDKPFAPTLAEARSLVALADKHGIMLSVFQNRRWDSDYLAVREAIQSGQLGRTVHLESRLERFRPEVRDRWRDKALPGSGLWFDLGPHLVDQSLQLFGLPDRVVASFGKQRDGAVIDDWAHVILEYGEMRVVLHCSMIGRMMPRFAVHGTLGSAIKQDADRQESQLLSGVIPGSGEWGRDSDPLVLIDVFGARQTRKAEGDQRNFYIGVAEHLFGRASNPVPGVQAIAVMAVLEAAVAAAAAGSSVALDLTDEEREAFSWSMTQG